MVTVDCIILAAGAASRFGSCKLLAEFQGQPLIAQAIRAASAVNPVRLLVVSGAFHSQLLALQASHPLPDFELHYYRDWQSGMGSSLAFAVQQLPHSGNPLLVLLADQARVNAQDLQNLLAWQMRHPQQIVCASFAGTLGVPAIFPAHFTAHLLQCKGERGAKPLLYQHAEQVIAVDMPNAEFDIDTPADLRRYLPSV